MAALIDEEEVVWASIEPVMAHHLAKLLMLFCDHCLNVIKFNELKKNSSLPNDYIIRILPQYSDAFCIVNHYSSDNSMEIKLIRWDLMLVVSTIEAVAVEWGMEMQYIYSLLLSWVKTQAKFDEFNDGTPYISMYFDDWKELEKGSISVVHELLSLTLWKKALIVKLEHFKREFGLLERLNLLLL